MTATAIDTLAKTDDEMHENSLTPGQGTPFGRLATRLFLPAGHGEVWIKHNVEEVGAFDEFLPSLYYKETGRRI